MYQRESRKKEVVHRVIIYALMTTTVLGLLVFLTLTVMGYRFNIFHRTVEQTGLVQFDSSPRGARVSIDGVARETTASKGVLLPGEYDFQLSLKGYADWNRKLSIRAGTVNWLTYPRLVPVKKNITTAHSFANLDQVATSPSRQFIIGLSSNEFGLPQVELIVFRNSREPKVSTHLLDNEQLTGYETGIPTGEHQLSIVRWDNSSRFVILQHRYQLDETGWLTEWLWLDRDQPNQLKNLSKTVNLPITSMFFAEGREVLFLQDNGDVRRMNVDDGTLSRPLLSGVNSFDVYDEDYITYTATMNGNTTAGILRNGWQRPVVLYAHQVAGESNIQIRASRYFNQDTLVFGDDQGSTIYRGVLPTTDESAGLFLQSAKVASISRPAKDVGFSPSGRFVLFEDEAKFTTYDLERLEMKRDLDKYQSGSLQWLDDFYIWQVNSDQQMVMHEFDGENSHQLMLADAKFDVVLTTDGKYVYGFVVEAEGQVELRRLSMTLAS